MFPRAPFGIRCCPPTSPQFRRPASGFSYYSASVRHQQPIRAVPGIVISMNAFAIGIAALTASLPAHTLLILGSVGAGFVLLIYIGIALPAIWSAKSARRKAAAAVLAQILTACTRTNRD
jgi:hypothetical protein